MAELPAPRSSAALPPLFQQTGEETLEQYHDRLGEITSWFAEDYRDVLANAGMPTDEIDHIHNIPDPVLRMVALLEAKDQAIRLLANEANYTGMPIDRDAFGYVKPVRFPNSAVLNTDLEKGSQIPAQLSKWGHAGDNFDFFAKRYYKKWANDITKYQHGMAGYGGDGVFVLVPEPHAVTNGALLAMNTLIKTNIIAEILYKLDIRTSEGKPHWTRMGLHGGEGTFVERGNIMNSHSSEIPMGRLFDQEYEKALAEQAPYLAHSHAIDTPLSGIHFVGRAMNESTRLQSFGKENVQNEDGSYKPNVHNTEESNIWMIEDVWRQLSDVLKDYFPIIAKNVAIRDIATCTNVHGLRRGTRFDLEWLMKECAREQGLAV